MTHLADSGLSKSSCRTLASSERLLAGVAAVMSDARARLAWSARSCAQQNSEVRAMMRLQTWQTITPVCPLHAHLCPTWSSPRLSSHVR